MSPGMIAITILLHFAPTLGGMAWSIHQHGFHLNANNNRGSSGMTFDSYNM